QSVEKDQRVDGFEGTALPGGDFVQDGVRHRADQIRRDVDAIEIAKMSDDFPEAIVAVFPEATVQTCIVDLLRHSLEFASYKDRKAVGAALKNIYRAIDPPSGEVALAGFEASPWGRKYPAIGQSWRRAWPEVVPFYAFHPDVRRLVSTINAIEALNSKLRRAF